MTHDIHLATLQRQPAAVVEARVTLDGIGDFIGAAFGEVLTVLGQQALAPTGPPFGRYHFDGDGVDVAAGFPVEGPVASSGRVAPDELPGGIAAYTIHVGPYETVASAHTDITAWLCDNGYTAVGDPWERYLDGPDKAQPRTEVFVPCRHVAPHSS